MTQPEPCHAMPYRTPFDATRTTACIDCGRPSPTMDYWLTGYCPSCQPPLPPVDWLDEEFDAVCRNCSRAFLPGEQHCVRCNGYRY